MKKRILILLLALIAIQPVLSQQRSLPERLGYPAGTKLLIIHADDIGVSHSENAASLKAFAGGMVSSGSIMVPCPWFPEIAEYARKNPTADLGLHLTLTAEWNIYKWGPVASREKVPSLVDENGFFYPDVASVVSKATPEDVETELRAQIERAKKFGIDITHFDSHMGTLFANPEFLKIYIALGREYKVPVLLIGAITAAFPGMTNEKDALLDQVYIASPDDYKSGMKEFYIKTLKSVQPGVSCLIIHTAYDDAEMQAVTIDHPDYGSAWRQADLDFFTSETCRQILREEKIQLITWKEIRDKLLR